MEIEVNHFSEDSSGVQFDSFLNHALWKTIKHKKGTYFPQLLSQSVEPCINMKSFWLAVIVCRAMLAKAYEYDNTKFWQYMNNVNTEMLKGKVDQLMDELTKLTEKMNQLTNGKCLLEMSKTFEIITTPVKYFSDY